MDNGITYDRNPIDNGDSMYSVGTGIAINGFEKHYKNNKHDVVMLNINTLVRNITTKDMAMMEIVDVFKREMVTLLNEVTSIMHYVNGGNLPVLFLYSVDYQRCVSSEILREPTQSREMISLVVKHIIRNAHELFGRDGNGYFNGIHTYYRTMDKPNVPVAKQLWNALTQVTHHRTVIMVSYSPMEYLLKDMVKLIVLESHTGAWRKPHEFSKKTFGPNFSDIPFYLPTLICIGDKNVVKPQLGIKQKRDLLEVAETENWKTKTGSAVRSSILRLFPDLKKYIT